MRMHACRHEGIPHPELWTNEEPACPLQHVPEATQCARQPSRIDGGGGSGGGDGGDGGGGTGVKMAQPVHHSDTQLEADGTK